MARPRKTDRPVEKTLCLPTSLVARVDLELMSELEQKVPFGAWQAFVIRLIERHFQRKAAAPADAELFARVQTVLARHGHQGLADEFRRHFFEAGLWE